MSYILDALRKAEAEREVAGNASHAGGLGIHAPAAAPGPEIKDDPAHGSAAGLGPVFWWAAGLGCLVLGGALTWWWAVDRPSSGQPVSATVLAEAPAPRPAARALVLPPADPAPAIEPVPATEAVAPVTAPAPWAGEASPSSRTPPRTPARVPAKTRMDTESRVPAQQPDAVAPSRASRPATPSEPSSTGETVAAASADRVYALHELPDGIRRQLPQLSVGGAMYSDNAASRMLILNGQPFHEGSQPLAHLRLEQINLKSAVLSFKGYRYRIDY